MIADRHQTRYSEIAERIPALGATNRQGIPDPFKARRRTPGHMHFPFAPLQIDALQSQALRTPGIARQILA